MKSNIVNNSQNKAKFHSKSILSFLLAFYVFLFGTIFIFTRMIIPPLNAISYICLRSLIGTIPYLIWFLSNKNFEKIKEYYIFFKANKKQILIFTIGFFTIPLIILFFATKYTTASNQSILNSFATPLIALIDIIIFKRKQPREVLISIFISTLGILLIIYPFNFQTNATLKGDLLVIIAIIISAFGNIFFERLSKTHNSSYIGFSTTIFPGLFLIPFLFIDNQFKIIFSLNIIQWLLLLWLGLFISGLGYWIVSSIYSFESISAEKLGITNGLVFLIGYFLGIIIFNDEFALINLFGAILVIISIININIKKKDLKSHD
ncbi:MAG: DMT family transporter [Promethearchaeota archaeon]